MKHNRNADIIADDKQLQEKFGFDAATMENPYEHLRFRLYGLLSEEMQETLDAFENGDAEELVDGLIDLIVIAVGTLSIYKVDISKAWREVYRANISKERGTKSTRPESGGIDLIKPDDWEKPHHHNNHGMFDEVLKEKT